MRVSSRDVNINLYRLGIKKGGLTLLSLPLSMRAYGALERTIFINPEDLDILSAVRVMPRVRQR